MKILVFVFLLLFLLGLFVYQVHLLIETIQCASEMKKFGFLSTEDRRSDANDFTVIPHKASRCKYATFLSNDEFVLVDFESDCIKKIWRDGGFLLNGYQCLDNAHRARFIGNSIVFMDNFFNASFIYFKRLDGIYICDY